MSNVDQQTQEAKVRGVADIMFCIDNSGSMSDCIAGVMNHAQTFITELEGYGANNPIDWQLGVCLYNSDTIHFLDLTKDLSAVQKLLAMGVENADEFTPGAIDFTITNASWRRKSHRVIINFTDETLETGSSNCESDRGAGKFDDLIAKMGETKIKLFYNGPYCEYYDEFNGLDKAIVNKVTDFATVDYKKLLENIAKTVSQTAGQNAEQEGARTMPGLIYNLNPINIKKY